MDDEQDANLRMAPIGQVNGPVEVTHLQFEGGESPVRVVLDERDGHTVYVREATEDDGPEPPTVTVDPSVDKIVRVTRVKFAGMHTTNEVGRVDDLFLAVRVVPAGREGNLVYGRGLRHDEIDTGESIRLLPGDRLVFPAGSLSVELEAIDERMPAGEDGYRPLAEPLWTWLYFPGDRREDFDAGRRYLIAAARRLDTAHLALTRVRDGIHKLDEAKLGYEKMRVIHQVIGDVETMVIALSRAVGMTRELPSHFDVLVEVSGDLVELGTRLKEIRDAYEHIDERARGRIRSQPDPEALTVFDYETLLGEGTVRYRDARVSLAEEIPQLINGCRDLLKQAASKLAEEPTREEGTTEPAETERGPA